MQLQLSLAVMLLWLSIFNQQIAFDEDNSTELLIHVNSASNNEGVIRVFLLNSKEQFDDLQGHYKACTKAVRNRRVTCRFDDIVYGDYVVFSFHDKNLDTELNFNLLQSPSEKMALSNIDLADNDDPTFEQSKFN